MLMLRPLRLAPRLVARLSRRMPLCTAADPKAPPEPPPAGDRTDGTGHEEAELRWRVLEASMLEVPEHGWTVDALAAGAVACGLSPAAHGILARGPIELVRHFSLGCDVALHAELVAREAELAELTVQNRLVLAVQTRLRLLEPHAKTWPQALALRALPSNLAESVSDAHELAGLLLSACGADARVPMAPEPVDDHLKRVSVGAVYAAAELYLLTDRRAASCAGSTSLIPCSIDTVTNGSPISCSQLARLR